MTDQITNNENTQAAYFDMHTTGVAYLNRARVVTPRQGKPFYAVTLAAMHGKSDDMQYTHIDCRVVGSEAKQYFESLKSHIDEEQAVLIGFVVGDIYPDAFIYEKGDKQGKPGASIKGRLLRIKWAKINGANFILPNQETPLANAS